uniref:Uncharacterized protein n=1 Tax=Lactuca sativa TaxID=4236 RepID=A0A9R1VIS1_LACSA|nr:hypothetical protein LSAT_V11C500268730 [Lactuca sativa]
MSMFCICFVIHLLELKIKQKKVEAKTKKVDIMKMPFHGYSPLDKANLIDLYTRVELKFEHRNSKDCSYGPLYEWQLYMYASNAVRLRLLAVTYEDKIEIN